MLGVNPFFSPCIATAIKSPFYAHESTVYSFVMCTISGSGKKAEVNTALVQ